MRRGFCRIRDLVEALLGNRPSTLIFIFPRSGTDIPQSYLECIPWCHGSSQDPSPRPPPRFMIQSPGEFQDCYCEGVHGRLGVGWLREKPIRCCSISSILAKESSAIVVINESIAFPVLRCTICVSLISRTPRRNMAKALLGSGANAAMHDLIWRERRHSL